MVDKSDGIEVRIEGQICNQKSFYDHYIRYRDETGELVSKIFQTREFKGNTTMGGFAVNPLPGRRKGLLNILEVEGKVGENAILSGVEGFLLNQEENENEEHTNLKVGESFQVSIRNGVFNPKWQYSVQLISLADMKIKYQFTTNNHLTTTPFNTLSSEITIKEKIGVNQYVATIKGIDTAGNECDIKGTLSLQSSN